MSDAERYHLLRQTWITRHPARVAAYNELEAARAAWHPFDADCDRSAAAHFVDPAAHLRAAGEVAARVGATRAALAGGEVDLGIRFDEAAREVRFPGALAVAAAPGTGRAQPITDPGHAEWNEPRRDAALTGLDGAATCISECRSLVRRGFVNAADVLLDGAERNLAEARAALGVRP